MKKKILATAIATMMVASLVTGCGDDTTETSAELEATEASVSEVVEDSEETTVVDGSRIHDDDRLDVDHAIDDEDAEHYISETTAVDRDADVDEDVPTTRENVATDTSDTAASTDADGYYDGQVLDDGGVVHIDNGVTTIDYGTVESSVGDDGDVEYIEEEVIVDIDR